MSSPDPILRQNPARDPQLDMMELSEQTQRIVAITQTLLLSGRSVDLDGLQKQVGLLCARALDLPPGETGLAKAELCRIAERLDGLEQTMRNVRT